MSDARVFQRHKRYSGGHQNEEDDECSSTSKTRDDTISLPINHNCDYYGNF